MNQLFIPIVLFLSSAPLQAMNTFQYCGQCTPANCASNSEVYNACKRCDIPHEQFESCRLAAEKSGLLNQGFSQNMRLSEGQGLTLQEAAFKMDILNQFLETLSRRSCAVINPKEKQKLQANIQTIKDFINQYKNEIGITQPGLKGAGVSLKNWSNEKYTSITSSINTLDKSMCQTLVAQASKMLDNRQKGINRILSPRFKNKEQAKVALESLTADCNRIPSIAQQGMEAESIYAEHINGLYNYFLSLVNKTK